MSYELIDVGRIKFLEQSGSYTSGNFGQVNTNTASYFDMKVEPDSVKLGLVTNFAENKTMRQRVDDFYFKVKSFRASELTVMSYLNGIGSVTPGTTPNGRMLRTIMGGENISTGSICGGTGSNAWNIKVGSQAYSAGQALGIINSSNGLLECSRILTTSTGTASLIHQFQTTPTSGSQLYGAATYYLTQNPTGSFSAYCQWAEGDATWYATGLQGGFNVKTEIGELATIEYQLKGTMWQTGSAATLFSVDYTSDSMPPAFVDSYVRLGAWDATLVTFPTASVVEAQKTELSPAIQWDPIKSPSGLNTIVAWRRKRNIPVATAKVTIPYQDRTFFTARENSTPYFLEIQVGSTPGNTVLISCPYVQIVDVQITGQEEILSQEITLDIHEIGETIAQTLTIQDNDLARSAISIHYL